MRLGVLLVLQRWLTPRRWSRLSQKTQQRVTSTSYPAEKCLLVRWEIPLQIIPARCPDQRYKIPLGTPADVETGEESASLYEHLVAKDQLETDLVPESAAGRTS